MAKKKSFKKQKKEKQSGAEKKVWLHSETKKSILVVSFFALGLLSALSFFEAAGVFGRHFVEISKIFFGKGYFFVCISFLLAGLVLLVPRSTSQGKIKNGYQTALIGVLIFTLSVLGVFYLIGVKNGLAETALMNGKLSREAHNQGLQAGGYLGAVFGYVLARYFGFWAGLTVLVSCLIISVLISFNLPLVPRLEQKAEQLVLDRGEAGKENKKEGGEGLSKPSTLWQKIKTKTRQGIQEAKEARNKGKSLTETNLGVKPPKNTDFQPSSGKITKLASDFKLPSLDFLEKETGQPASGDIQANINIIKRTLENFGIEVEMGDVNVGPTVTQYTLRPAQGIKLSKITALQNDLALALAAHPLRIEAPIPGHSLVGIEIPNRRVVTVRLRSLLEGVGTEQMSRGLTFALGRDVAGRPILADLCKMPHLLVAGATGTGKTITLNSLIVSLIYYNTPENIKFILIDPKRVELTAYESIPYLMAPVIVRPEKAVGALRWAVSEMERRFEVLQEASCRNIVAYNNGASRKGASLAEYLPYIVIIIDELADLMASHGREAEAGIVRLAQMARAVGIHLVVSTQRPSVEVITGLIKANITSRIAMQVASQIDSRTILDMAGAEKLLGNGDMLFLSGNSAKPCRVQGAYISDKEVKKVAGYLKKEGQPDYREEVTSNQTASRYGHTGGIAGSGGQETDDVLYQEARKLVIASKRASASLLQRRLRVGYARAARLLDILEEKGVVGPAEGAKPRQVFLDERENSEKTEENDF